jgi:hypothetical protein
MENIQDDNSFSSWLLSKHAWAEKTVGAVVLVVEILGLLGEVYHGVSRAILSQILNLVFLLFIFVYLLREFNRRFSVNTKDLSVGRILRFPEVLRSQKEEENVQAKIGELVFNANTLISQLRNINYFVLFTAGLYAILLTQSVFAASHLIGGSENYGMTSSDVGFHFAVDLFSYLGAFFLLRCFFVMYLPTIDENGNDVLWKRTGIYALAGAFFLIFDVVVTLRSPRDGIFISEFICGVVNAVVFILLIARFENKILDIPPWILCLLYVYAILQTCLPFVTENPLTTEIMAKNAELKKTIEEFRGIVLTICLVGKVTLCAVILYVLTSGRIFYYFITLRKIHDEEEENWTNFSKLIMPFALTPERFSIIYEIDKAGVYTARIPHLFSRHVKGEGATKIQAKVDLLNKIRDPAGFSHNGI